MFCIYSVNKLDALCLSYDFVGAVKSALERGTSKGFHTTQLFGFVTQGIGPITKPLAAIQKTKIPLQFGSMAKAAWEPGRPGVEVTISLLKQSFSGNHQTSQFSLMVILGV